MSRQLSDFKNYIGDVNLEYGGLFFSLDDFKYGYADCLVVHELPDFYVMVERITVHFDDSERVKSALQSSGWDNPEQGFKKLDTYGRKCAIIDSCFHYTGGETVEDFGGPHRWIIQTDPDFESREWDKDITFENEEDLFKYLLGEGFLSEFE